MIKLDLLGLYDILDLNGKIQRQVMPLGRAAFLDDIDAQDATSFRLLHIGEAVRALSEDLREWHPQIAWRQIIAMRNLLAHEYFMSESNRIWRVLTNDLDALAAVCRAEIIAAGFDPALSCNEMK